MLSLTRENKLRHQIRRKAFRRFIHGCPPRKSDDLSLGDAFDWEWMIYCAKENRAELVVVSRDQDYGIELDKRVYVNDHLKQEFSERVSKKRKFLLYTKLSDALKHFAVKITPEEEAVETEIMHFDLDIAQPSPITVRSRTMEISVAEALEKIQAAITRAVLTSDEITLNKNDSLSILDIQKGLIDLVKRGFDRD